MGFLLELKAKLDWLFASAEDPRAATDSVSQPHGDLMARLDGALHEVAASKSRLQSQIRRLKQGLPELESQSREALRAGREDAARLTLKRRGEAAAELQRIEAQVMELAWEEERLALARQRLGAQMQAFRTRQEVISARYTAAETQVRVNEALAGLSEDLAGRGTALEQAEATTERMQARASAIDELMDMGSWGRNRSGRLEEDSLDHGESPAVELELAALRRDIEQNGHGGEADAPR